MIAARTARLEPSMAVAQPLPISLVFEPDRLATELEQFAAEDWLEPDRGSGRLLHLVAVGGSPENGSARGPMLATPNLQRCPALRRVLAQLRAPLGRVRIWQLPNGIGAGDLPDEGCDEHIRVHVVVTGTAIFRAAPASGPVTMATGQAWLLPAAVAGSFTGHGIQLVIETVGSSHLGRLAGGERPALAVEGDGEPPLAFERVNYPVVMTPWQLEHLVARTAYLLAPSAAERDALFSAAETLVQDWRALWACLGDSEEAMASYEGLLARFASATDALAGHLPLADGRDAIAVLRGCLLAGALNPDLRPPAPGDRRGEAPGRTAVRPHTRFDRPVFIVAAPRSGSSLLFETLAQSASVWTVGGESHAEFEGIPELHPVNRGWTSNRLAAADATPAVGHQLHTAFLRRLKDRAGRRLPEDGSAFRLLEKTPKNALRIPFLARLFPDARFIYLYRDPRSNISSIIEAWRSGRFVTYPQLPGWTGPAWSLALIPGWRELIGAQLEDIAAAQWRTINETMLADLGQLPKEHWCAIGYEEFIGNPDAAARRLARFAQVEWDRELAHDLPLSRHTLTPPDPDKWRTNESLVEAVISRVDAVDRACRTALARQRP
jgi:hypothetical protein